MENQVIKMSHICVIQQLKEKILQDPLMIQKFYSYEILGKMSLKELEELRDDLIKQYNQVLEDREFGAEMIYKGKGRENEL
jgi:hypothetical protein